MNGQCLYEVYAASCPCCGNSENNRDHGPYEYHPLDDFLGGPPDPRVHLMSCGSCGKCFDAAPQKMTSPDAGRAGEEAVPGS